MSVITRCLTIAGFFSLISGCALVLDDTPEEDQSKYEYSNWESNPNSSTYEYFKCSESGTSSRLCGYRPNASGNSPTAGTGKDYTWQSNCRGSDCQILNVFAHYSLQENLGNNQTLIIEAFQNPQFSGSPVANIQIAGFDASRPNSSNLEEMYLASGEYYFRAYFTTGQSPPTPYPMDGMILVGDKPVGVYGALSGAKRVLVKMDQKPELVNIYINQLFKKPGSEQDSNDRIRLRISVPAGLYIPADRDIRVLVLNSPDIEESPAYNFTLSSNLLLIKAQETTTEFVSPSLAPKFYYLFAFVDSNGNAYYDDAELGAFYLEKQEVSSFPVERDRTRSLQLSLQPYTDR